MFWKYGLFFSILSGGIWGVFWQIFFTVVGILTLGTPLSLELSQIMIIGPLAGILYIKSQKFLSIKFHLTAIIIVTFLILQNVFFTKNTQKKNYQRLFTMKCTDILQIGLLLKLEMKNGKFTGNRQVNIFRQQTK